VDVNNHELAVRAGSSPVLPTEIALHQNYPNPFNPATRISFSLPNTGQVRLDIFNFLGQRVSTLVDSTLEAGYHELIWDGNDSDGGTAASGIYFYRIETDRYVDSRRMMLLK